MEGAVIDPIWLDVTNVICNTVQVLGLAYIAQMVQHDITRRKREREDGSRGDTL